MSEFYENDEDVLQMIQHIKKITKESKRKYELDIDTLVEDTKTNLINNVNDEKDNMKQEIDEKIKKLKQEITKHEKNIKEKNKFNKPKNFVTYADYKYIGKLNNKNEHHGIGIILYNSGESFYGSFINGKKEGKGIYIDKNLTRYINTWVDNKVFGKVKVVPYNSNRVYYFYYKNYMIEKCIYFDNNINNKESHHKNNIYNNYDNNSYNNNSCDDEEKRKYPIGDNVNCEHTDKMNISLHEKNDKKNEKKNEKKNKKKKLFKYFSNNIENLIIENYQTWSLREVIQWLMLCNVPVKWLISFYKNNITGDKLKYININTIRNELGIIAYGHAIKILQLIKNLQVMAYNKKFNNLIQIEEYKNYIRQKENTNKNIKKGKNIKKEKNKKKEKNIKKEKKKKKKETKKFNNMDKKYIDLAIHKNVKNIQNDTFYNKHENIYNCKNQTNFIYQNDSEIKKIMNKKKVSFEYDNNEEKKKKNIIKFIKNNKSLQNSNGEYYLINHLSKERLPSYEKKLLSSSQSNIEHIKNLPLDVLSNNNSSANIKIKKSKSKYNNDKKEQKKLPLILNKSSSEFSPSHSYTSKSYHYNIKPSLQSSSNNSSDSSYSISSTCSSSSSYVSSLYSNRSNDILNFYRNKIIKYCNNIYMNTKLAYSYMNGFIIPHEDLIFIHPIENYYMDNTNEKNNINNPYTKEKIMNHNFSFNTKNNTSFIDINTNIFSSNKQQNINNFGKYKKMKSRMFKGKYMGKEVAIKILVGKIKNFKKLHQILYNLYNLRHSNLVLIMGVSIHYPFVFIIYEYMKNKCLFSYLHCIKYKHVYISTFLQRYKTLLHITQQEKIKKTNNINNNNNINHNNINNNNINHNNINHNNINNNNINNNNINYNKDYNNKKKKEDEQHNIEHQDTFIDLPEKSNISSDDNNSTDISQIQKENFHFLNKKIEENKNIIYDDHTSTLSDHSIHNINKSYDNVYKNKMNIFHYQHNVLCGAYDNNDNNINDNDIYCNNIYDNNINDNHIYCNNINDNHIYCNNIYDHHKNTSLNSKEQNTDHNIEQINECNKYASETKYNIKKSNLKNNIISHKNFQKCNQIQMNQPYTFPPYQKELSSYLKNEKIKRKRKEMQEEKTKKSLEREEIFKDTNHNEKCINMKREDYKTNNMYEDTDINNVSNNTFNEISGKEKNQNNIEYNENVKSHNKTLKLSNEKNNLSSKEKENILHNGSGEINDYNKMKDKDIPGKDKNGKTDIDNDNNNNNNDKIKSNNILESEINNIQKNRTDKKKKKNEVNDTIPSTSEGENNINKLNTNKKDTIINNKDEDKKKREPEEKNNDTFQNEQSVYVDEVIKEYPRIFATRLPFEASKKDLEKYFSKFGKIVDIYVSRNISNNKNKGFGFVSFEKQESMNKVLKEKLHIICGKEIVVDVASMRDDKYKHLFQNIKVL
ncbi:hypothetical protein PFFCH_02070 [Plasmodium falciparum FCH/4]|uniref:Uncharacterized protein n=1 Tax=Plasmodium falciparum FCH/4 TaxID=1036724 RepID=A0A024VPV9_PLAFA|nr:hypothetical protein PFFCH_02070 [Plasmodium falciparum FCH/4]